MNSKRTISLALLATSAAFAFDLWDGAQGSPQVVTGLDNGTETSGYWFAYDDSNDKGKSKVVWANGVSAEPLDGGDLSDVIVWCSGVCGTAVLDKGDLTYNPFVGIGFNVLGEAEGGGDPEAGDATEWGGICISYASEAAPDLELGLGSVDADILYANPSAHLKKATAGNVADLAWEDFKQPTWYKGDVKIPGPDAAKQLVAVKFKIQALPDSYKFRICAVGPKGACGSLPYCDLYGPSCCTTPPAIKAVRGASVAKAILNGRTLSFTGVSAGTAEVLNLQGQVVAKGDVSSALSLANLDAGVYMVRVAGKSANFTDMIVLK